MATAANNDNIRGDNELLTPDEIKKLGEALKDDNFRKLFLEYAEEMNDPENRKKYEEELKIFERERGMDVSFIYPEGNYVMKSVTKGEQQRKVFINVCSNKLVEKPSCSRVESGSNTPAGLNWNIPYFLSRPQDDLDKAGRPCTVYDTVFNGDTLYMSQKNSRFREMVEQTALDGIEEKFNIRIKRDGIQYPKMKYKGKPIPSVIRKKIETTNEVDDGNQFLDEVQKENVENTSGNDILVNGERVVVCPKYTVKHRSTVDMEDYTILAASSPNTRPKELVISIELPQVEDIDKVELDLHDRGLKLVSHEKTSYDLALELPYPIYKHQGRAKYTSAKKVLDVLVKVIPFEAEAATKNERLLDKRVTPRDKDKTAVKSEDNHEMEDTNEKNADNKEEIKQLEDVNDLMEKYQSDKCNIAPDFICNQTNETLALVVYVKNVEKDLVKVEITNCKTAIMMTATTEGDNYTLALKLTEDLKIDDYKLDITEKNIVLKIGKSKPICYAGMVEFLNENGWNCYNFQTENELVNTHLKYKDQNENMISCVPLNSQDVTVKDITEAAVTVAFQMPSDNGDEVKADRPTKLDAIQNDPQSCFANFKQRTSSESSEMSEDLNPMRRYRGILKHSGSVRSISESSDDFGWSCHDLISPESDCGDSSDRPKKSVRFSDNISRAIFKANSSILGQKKKNQKRNLNKKKSAAKKGKYSGTSGSESEGTSGTSDVEVNDDKESESVEDLPTETLKSDLTSIENNTNKDERQDNESINNAIGKREQNNGKTDDNAKIEKLDFWTSKKRVFALDNNPDFRTNRDNNCNTNQSKPKRGTRKQRNKAKNSNNNNQDDVNDSRVMDVENGAQFSDSLSDNNNDSDSFLSGNMFELD